MMTTLTNRLAPFVTALTLFGCTTTDDETDSPPDDTTVLGSNVWNVTVDPSSADKNLPEASVRVCVPGTQKCQTVPHILVDTASTGLRIYSAALKYALPEEHDGLGNRIGDCAWNYWGFMHTADVQLAGLKAPNVPIEVIEPSGPFRPSWCTADTQYDPSRYNGIIGISPDLTDTMAYGYFSCSDSGCTQGGIDASLQVANVSAHFPTDNNGLTVQFGSVPDQGTRAITGHITFGVGTRTNNSLPDDVLVIEPKESWGNFDVESNGQTYESALDSGTWSYNIPYLSNELCPNDTVHLCPSGPQSIPVDVENANGDVAYLTSFDIVNYDQYPAANMAFDNLGTAWPGSQQLMLGLPYFFGRTIYYGFADQSTPAGTGPWVGLPATTGNQRYRIENVALGLSLDDEVLDASGNYTGQMWRIEAQPLTDGDVRLTNNFKGTGQSLDTANDGVYEPAMRATGNDTGQMWRITPAGDGTFRLTNEFRGTGSSLEAQPDGTLHMAPNTSSPAQYWKIVQF